MELLSKGWGGGGGGQGPRSPCLAKGAASVKLQSPGLRFWEGCRGRSREPYITPEREEPPKGVKRATSCRLNDVTSDNLHVHAEGWRRGKGDAESCTSILELKRSGWVRGGRRPGEPQEPLSLSQGRAGHRLWARTSGQKTAGPSPPRPSETLEVLLNSSGAKSSPQGLKVKG